MFKPCDKVICIENRPGSHILEINKIYTVFEVRDNWITLKESYYYWHTYQKNRFEPAYIKEFKNKLDLLIEE